MKRISLIAGLCVVCLIAGVIVGVKAQPQFVGASILVNNTTSNLTAAASVVTFVAPNRTAYIQHPGLANTNDQVYRWQFSLDQVNYINGAQWMPTVTNSTTETVSLTFTSIPVYLRAILITTNSQTTAGIF